MSTTVKIPGGEAVLIDSPDEMTGRRRRPAELIGARIGRVMEAVQKAARIYCEGELFEDRSEQMKDAEDGTKVPVFPGPDVDLTEKQLELTFKLNDAVICGLLLSWTLDRPIPTSPDELLDLDTPVLDALREEAAKINAAMGDGGFTVDALPADPEEEADPALPTSA
jgi:hypothetical protein